MAIESVLIAAREGLTYERLRMDAASRNIAAANVPVSPGATATHWSVDYPVNGFGHVLSQRAEASAQPIASRVVHDPTHPMANADGMVRYPGTDMVGEMTALMTASRGYEANVRSFNLLRSMMLRALEIGAK